MLNGKRTAPCCFVSCKKAEAILPPENIRVENDYLFWDEALHAEWYLVDIDGTEYEADTNSLNLFEITTEPKSSYQIRIKSCGDETVNYKKSEWSALCDYRREKQPFLFQSINNNKTEFVQNFKTTSGDVTLHTDALIAGFGIKYMEELL